MVTKNTFDIPARDEKKFRDFATHQSQEYDVRINITTEAQYGWLFWKRVLLLVEYEGKRDYQVDQLLEFATLSRVYLNPVASFF